MKLIAPGRTDAIVQLYYCKNHLLADMMLHWGRGDIIVQQFISSRSFKACIYRFYRNEKNVYRAECLINKKSVKQIEYAVTKFKETVEEVLDEQRESYQVQRERRLSVKRTQLADYCAAGGHKPN